MRITLDSKEYYVSGYLGDLSCSRIGAIQYEQVVDMSFFGYLISKIFSKNLIYNGKIISIITNADYWWGWYLYKQLPQDKDALFLIQEEAEIFSLLAVKNGLLIFYRVINIYNLEYELRITEQFLQTQLNLIRINTENADLIIPNLFEKTLKLIATKHSNNYIYFSYIFYIIPVIQTLYLGYNYYLYQNLERKLKQYQQLPHIKFHDLLTKQYDFLSLIPALNEANSISYVNNTLTIKTKDLWTISEILKIKKLKPKLKARQNLLAKAGEVSVSFD